MKCFYCGFWKGSKCDNDKSEFHGQKTGISHECSDGMSKEDILKHAQNEKPKELKMEKESSKKISHAEQKRREDLELCAKIGNIIKNQAEDIFQRCGISEEFCIRSVNKNNVMFGSEGSRILQWTPKGFASDTSFFSDRLR